MKSLPWRLRRAALALRQRDVADRAGVTQARYSLLERGEAIPTTEERTAIECALRLPDEVAQVVGSLASTVGKTPKGE